MLSPIDPDRVEEEYLAGIREAGEGGLHLVELQGRTRLVGLRRELGRSPDGSEELAALYATFTEGLDEHDLVMATEVLG
jgi:hypothetical protein